MIADSTRRFMEASLYRANAALRAARLFLKGGELRDAVSRAYYAMFHVARTVLHQRDITAKTHKGIQLMFDTRIAKKGLLSREYGEMFRGVFNLRQKCDYEVYTEPNRSETEGRRIFQPPLRRMAPATPPPIFKEELAALTTASTQDP